jgi:hypothetical protein
MAKNKSLSIKTIIIMIILIMLGLIFASTSVVLIFGMIPTFVAIFIDDSKEKLKPLTVGSMNLAGCFVFILDLWMHKIHDVSTALDMIFDPYTIMIIYGTAAIGYLIDWAMTGIVASISYQNGKARLRDIDKIQKKLVERWGVEVKGEVQLDAYGFPVDPDALQQLTAEDAEKEEKNEKE